MKKTFKVVMLPTNEKVDIGAPNWWLSNQKKLIINNLISNIYIISDDEIKEGDWVYDSSSLPQDAPIKRIRIIDDTHYTLYGDTSRNLKCHYKKIIATTDILDDINSPLYEAVLPQLPESFIQAYIKAYNQAKPITEVDLEMEKKQSHMVDILDSSTWDKWFIKIKTRPDNTVIVHQSKMYSQQEYNKLLEQIGQMQLEMYTRDEVIKLLELYEPDAPNKRTKFINENL